MGLEALTGGSVFIDALVETNPLGSDTPQQGDDHIRGIKNVLKNSFPSITAAMTRTAAQLNDTPTKAGTETITGAWTFSGDLNKESRNIFQPLTGSVTGTTGVHVSSAGSQTVARLGTGSYRVTHSFGATTYTVMLTPFQGLRRIHIAAQTATYFDVATTNTGSGSGADCDFHYSMMRYA